MKPRYLAIFPLAIMLCGTSANAASFFWDVESATAENQNGSGTWNTTNSNWTSAATVGMDPQVFWANNAADTAFLGTTTVGAYTNSSTGGTITLGENITAASLSMSSGQSGSYIIDPGAGPYTLTVGSIGNNNTTATLTVNAVVAGTTLTKVNAGKVILTAANTYTGATTVSAGTLSVSVVSGAGSNLGTASSAVTLGGVSNSVAVAGTLSYTGSTTSYSRGFTLASTGTGGRLDVTTVGQTLTVATGAVSGAGLFTVGGVGNTTITANLSHTGGLTKADAGILILSGTANTYNGVTTISGGTLDVGTISAGSLGSGGLLFSGGVLQGNGSFTRSFSGIATAGTNTLSGLSGGFAAKGGALNVNFGGAGALVQLSGGSFRFGTNLIFGSATADSKVTVVNPLDLNNSSRTITVNSGLGGDSAELSGVVSNAGPLASSQSLTKAGSGILLLSNANSYASATAVTGGTLQIGNSRALGYGGIQTTATTGTTVSSGSTLDLNGTTAVNEPIILSGSGIGGNGALINNSGTAASIGNGIAGAQVAAITGTGSGYSTAPTVIFSGTGTGATATATLGVTAASFSLAAGDKFYTVAPTVTITGGTGATATAILSGGASGNLIGITITNAGTGFTTAPVIAFGPGTFSSGTASASGTGNATSFNVSGIAMTAAGSGYIGTPTYTFGNGDATPGTVTLSSVTLAASSSIGGTGDTMIDAVVSESGGARVLTKTGTGTLTLTGANTYTGGTTLTGGKLVLSNNSAAGTAGIVVSGSSTTLEIGSGIMIANNVTVSNTTASVVHGIAAAEAYNVGTSGALKSSFATATPDTTAKILAGTSSGGSTLTMSFSDSSLATNDSIRLTDVFTVGGTGSDLYVLQLTASGLAADSVLAYNNGSIWDFAIAGNSGVNNASLSQQNYAGSFSAFQTAFGSILSSYQGAYGIDTTTNNVWAVVNHSGSFSAVPEPTSALAGALIGAGLLRRRRA